MQNTQKIAQLTDVVSVAVIIDGTFAGIAQGSWEVQNLITTYVEDNEVEDFNEDWISDYVDTYPLLSTNPLPLSYDVTKNIELEFEERGDEEESYTIEDISEEFDSMHDLKAYIESAISEGDYTAKQVATWDIKKVVSEYMDVEIEGADEFEVKAYGANKKMSDFIEVPPTIRMEVDYTELSNDQLTALGGHIGDIIKARNEGVWTVEEEVDTTDHEVALGHDTQWSESEIPDVQADSPTYYAPNTLEQGERIWALSEFYASQRLKAGKPVYLIDEQGRGRRTESIEEVQQYIDNGGMVGRRWDERDRGIQE